MPQTDHAGRILTAGMLAILAGEKPDYPGGLAPNSPDPRKVIREAKKRPRKSTINQYRSADRRESNAEEQKPEPMTAREKRLAAYVEAGMTMTDMAHEEGCDQRTIKLALSRLGLVAAGRKYKLLSQPELATVRRMALDGAPGNRIAREIGCHKSTIYQAMERMGVLQAWRDLRGL